MRKATGYVCVVAVGALAWSAAIGVAAAQTVTRVSTGAGGAQLSDASWEPAANADGRFVAFSSASPTLVVGDGNGTNDVFVKDRQTGVVTRVSVLTSGLEAAGGSFQPDLSADGRYVTFRSTAPLVADDTNGQQDIFRHDRTTGVTVRVSVATDGTQANGHSSAPRISADGRYVVFESLATNLVAGDTNQLGDIFLRDVLTSTTTRLSVSTTGVQSDRESYSPSISDDGARVSFLSDATTLDAGADPMACDAAVLACARVFVHTTGSATTTRVRFSVFHGLSGGAPEAFQVTAGFLSRDGRSVSVTAYGLVGTGTQQSSGEGFGTFSFEPGAPAIAEVVAPAGPVRPRALGSFAVDATGRFRAYCGGTTSFGLGLFDRQTWFAGISPVTAQPDCEGVAVSADGLTVFFASSGSTLVPGDSNGTIDVFALDLDGDHDGIPVAWEDFFRFSDADPTDGSIDWDGDGLTNRQEFVAGTHPRGFFKYYLAEGAQNAFFTIAIDIFRPKTTANEITSVIAQFQGQNGRRTTTPPLHLYSGPAGGGYWRIADGVRGLDPFPRPDQTFSTVIESEKRLAVERTMTWGGGLGAGYGSHAERAVTGPASTWYFAEGATHGGFDLFYLLQNPGSVTATATITYLLPAPRAPIVRAYTLLPNSRRTIYVDQEPGLDATDVSAEIAADRPIFAERAMYMTSGGQPFGAGTASAGITAPALQWFIAEGATGSFFDLFILIGNPSIGTAAVDITYLLPDGTTVVKHYEVAGKSRRTIGVKGEDPRLAATAVSATITSTNGTPVVVERAMWWPSPSWYEGTVTAATTTSAARWALAGGFIDPRPDTETYLLVANPGSVAANVTFDVGAGGLSADPAFPDRHACYVTVAVPARGRYTTGVKALCPAMGANLAWATVVAGTITSDGPPIVVERSTYWSTADQFWAAGASTLLTPLP
jgi:hypothetical protein